MSQDRIFPTFPCAPPNTDPIFMAPPNFLSLTSAEHPSGERMAVLRQLALLLWKNYTLQVCPTLGDMAGGRACPPCGCLGRQSGAWKRWHRCGREPWEPTAPPHDPSACASVSLPEAESPGDGLGTPPALAVFWDPDLASLEDPIGECPQGHHIPRPAHPGAALVLHLPSSRRYLGARLHPVTERCREDHHGDGEESAGDQHER